MKKFLIRLGVFALIILICDIAVGFAGAKLLENAKGGDSKRSRYMARETNADVLIFGSSRALHHYDPDILGKELGMSVYNCGFDANGIICAYGFYKLITRRYRPKIILYELTPWHDVYASDNNMYLENLRYFYDDCQGIDSIFWKVDRTERYKMMSRMYRFNSKLPRLVVDNLYPLHDYNNGYLPIDREMEIEHPPFVFLSNRPDRLKLYYLERLIKDTQGKTKLIFVVSPFYRMVDCSGLEQVKRACAKCDVPFLDHSTDSTLNRRRDFFSDSYHLNRRGATEYSRLVAREIKAALAQ